MPPTDGGPHRRPAGFNHLACGAGVRTLTIFVVATGQAAGTRAKDSHRNDTCQVLDSIALTGDGSVKQVNYPS
jgi:hypothetical protein